MARSMTIVDEDEIHRFAQDDNMILPPSKLTQVQQQQVAQMKLNEELRTLFSSQKRLSSAQQSEPPVAQSLPTDASRPFDRTSGWKIVSLDSSQSICHSPLPPGA